MLLALFVYYVCVCVCEVIFVALEMWTAQLQLYIIRWFNANTYGHIFFGLAL